MQELSNLYDFKVLGKLLIIGSMTSFYSNNKINKFYFHSNTMEWKQEYGAIFATGENKCTQHLKLKTTLSSWENQSLNLWDFCYLACVFMWFGFQIAWLHQQLHMHEGILLYGRLILKPLSF